MSQPQPRQHDEQASIPYQLQPLSMSDPLNVDDDDDDVTVDLNFVNDDDDDLIKP